MAIVNFIPIDFYPLILIPVLSKNEFKKCGFKTFIQKTKILWDPILENYLY
jgi:hypothetical protein